jgi:methylaspartate ammonia-lyase
LKVLATPGLGAFFFDDQAAIAAGAERDGVGYRDAGVREPAEAVSIQLVLDDGYVARGDCASVQYSGAGGREPRLRSVELAPLIERALQEALAGRSLAAFRELAADVEARLPGRAAAYGASQALLDAAAHLAGHHLMSRVVMDEWGLPGTAREVPLYAQSGEERRSNVEKMILKRVPVIPHGLINTPELVGPGGAALREYIEWIRGRLVEGYAPVLHFDVYGQIGAVAGGDIAATAEIIASLERAAGPLQLRIEQPIHGRTREEQIELLAALRGSTGVEIVADEWANTLDDIRAFVEAGAADLIQIKTPDLGSIHNTVDAVLLCQRSGVGTVLGGSCAETDISARVTANVGVATGATQMLAKPGMGVDEGLAIVGNEMARAVRLDRLVA